MVNVEGAVREATEAAVPVEMVVRRALVAKEVGKMVEVVVVREVVVTAVGATEEEAEWAMVKTEVVAVESVVERMVQGGTAEA